MKRHRSGAAGNDCSFPASVINTMCGIPFFKHGGLKDRTEILSNLLRSALEITPASVDALFDMVTELGSDPRHREFLVPCKTPIFR